MPNSLVPAEGIVIAHSLLTRLQTARTQSLPNETGGFLIGRRRGPHIEITDATFKGAADASSPFSFERADETHGHAILSAWEFETRKASLVGDWHSHPTGNGEPSGADRRAWRQLVDAVKADGIGLILAEPILPRVFLTRRRPALKAIVECRLHSNDSDDVVFAVHDRA